MFGVADGQGEADLERPVPSLLHQLGLHCLHGEFRKAEVGEVRAAHGETVWHSPRPESGINVTLALVPEWGEWPPLPLKWEGAKESAGTQGPCKNGQSLVQPRSFKSCGPVPRAWGWPP